MKHARLYLLEGITQQIYDSYMFYINSLVYDPLKDTKPLMAIGGAGE